MSWDRAFMRGSKFGNVPTRIDGVLFHSKKEARRYQVLKAMEAAGLITELELQPVFDLVVSHVRVCRYIADFQYRDLATGAVVVEDVKGVRTKEYTIKARLMLACLGIDVLET